MSLKCLTIIFGCASCQPIMLHTMKITWSLVSNLELLTISVDIIIVTISKANLKYKQKPAQDYNS